MRRLLASAVICLVCLSTAGAPAHAQRRRQDHEAARSALARGETQPLTKILAIALAKAPGDVLKIELEEDRGVLIYEVVVLSKDGRVRVVEVDARTGVVTRFRGD